MHEYIVEQSEATFNLAHCLSSGQVFRWRAIAHNKWLGVDGSDWYRIGRLGNALIIQSNVDEAGFRQLFRLDQDLSEIEKQLSTNGPEITTMIRSLQGLRVMRLASAEEVFFGFICSQNNHVTRIAQMVNALAAFGPVIAEVDGIQLHAFPAIETIAAIDELELREKRFGYRAPTIVNAAKTLVERGDGWLTSLRNGSYEEAHAELVAIKGLGPKLADCIALFGLHFTQAVPIDTHIWQQIVRHYRPDWAGQALTDRRYKEAGMMLRERFGKHAGWAQQYLFYDNLLNWRSRREPEAGRTA